MIFIFSAVRKIFPNLIKLVSHQKLSSLSYHSDYKIIMILSRPVINKSILLFDIMTNIRVFYVALVACFKVANLLHMTIYADFL